MDARRGTRVAPNRLRLSVCIALSSLWRREFPSSSFRAASSLSMMVVFLGAMVMMVSICGMVLNVEVVILATTALARTLLLTQIEIEDRAYYSRCSTPEPIDESKKTFRGADVMSTCVVDSPVEHVALRSQHPL